MIRSYVMMDSGELPKARVRFAIFIYGSWMEKDLQILMFDFGQWLTFKCFLIVRFCFQIKIATKWELQDANGIYYVS